MFHRRMPLPVVVALAAGALLPASAPAAPPTRLKDVATGVSGTILGAGDARTLAVRTAGGAVTLLGDGGARRTVPALSGCTASTAGSGRIAWDCGDVGLGVAGYARTVVVTDLAGAEKGRVAVPHPYDLGPARAVGAVWVAHLYPDPNRKGAWTVWTNWFTGEQRTIDRRDPAIYANLDSTGLVAAYCAPVRAQAIAGWEGYSGDLLRPVQYRAPWAIVDTRHGPPYPSNPVRSVLRRCGLSRAVTIPASLSTATAPTLGDGWVAWVPATKRSVRNAATPRSLHLLRLADRRRYVTHASGAVVLTARAAWITTQGGALRRVALPR